MSDLSALGVALVNATRERRTLKTRHCDGCIHFAYDRQDAEETGDLCSKGHRPRFYLPRNHNPHDPIMGWRRKCADFEAYETRC